MSERWPDRTPPASRTELRRLAIDNRHRGGPFDVIGDVHGCYQELRALLADLGYEVAQHAGRWRAVHPQGRRLVFAGDLVNRGPKSVEVLALVVDLCAAGDALCVAGNHEEWLRSEMRASHDAPWLLAQRAPEYADCEPEELARFRRFLDGLAGHLVLDGGRLVVAHAGLPEPFHGDPGDRARRLATLGEMTGEKDALGMPVRRDWAAGYSGGALVVQGHTPVRTPRWLNGTVDIDTGCVYGGSLTALRYPERTTVSVPAVRRFARACFDQISA